MSGITAGDQSQWLQSFHTAKWTIDGYESMHMLCKGQVKRLGSEDMRANVEFTETLSAFKRLLRHLVPSADVYWLKC